MVGVERPPLPGSHSLFAPGTAAPDTCRVGAGRMTVSVIICCGQGPVWEGLLPQSLVQALHFGLQPRQRKTAAAVVRCIPGHALSQAIVGRLQPSHLPHHPLAPPRPTVPAACSQYPLFPIPPPASPAPTCPVIPCPFLPPTHSSQPPASPSSHPFPHLQALNDPDHRSRQSHQRPAAARLRVHVQVDAPLCQLHHHSPCCVALKRSVLSLCAGKSEGVLKM